jgi:hypothetical protein
MKIFDVGVLLVCFFFMVAILTLAAVYAVEYFLNKEDK